MLVSFLKLTPSWNILIYLAIIFLSVTVYGLSSYQKPLNLFTVKQSCSAQGTPWIH